MRDTPFAEEECDLHAFLGSRVHVRQPRRGFRSGSDAVLLAASVPARPGETVLELGAGAGVASFCLFARVSGIRLSALEVQPGYAALMRDNAAALGVETKIYTGDVAAPPPSLRAQVFDHVMANPPYYRADSAAALDDAGRDTAFRGAESLGHWIDCGLRRLRPGGWLTLIQRTERLADTLHLLGGRAGDIAIRPLSAQMRDDATRFVLRAKKGARGPLRLCASLVLHTPRPDGAAAAPVSPEAETILREGAALDFDPAAVKH